MHKLQFLFFTRVVFVLLSCRIEAGAQWGAGFRERWGLSWVLRFIVTFLLQRKKEVPCMWWMTVFQMNIFQHNTGFDLTSLHFPVMNIV